MKKSIVLLLVWGIGGLAFGQSSNSLLWEVSGNGLKKSSYLFGTYHLISSSFIDSLPVIHQCYAKTEGVVGEMVLDPSMASKMMSAVLMKDSTLDELMSPEEYKLVGTYLKETSGMNIALFNKMKPVVVGTLFYKAIMPANDTGKPMDLYFQEESKADGKRVVGLETLDEQMDVLFNGTSLKQQAAALVKAAREKEKYTAEMMRTNRCYRDGDMDCLVKFMTEDETMTTAEMERLLYARNRNWMKQLPGLMSAGPVFVAVGAGHLPGEGGLIGLLKQAGYTVTPVAIR